MGAPEGAQPSTKLASVPERLDRVTVPVPMGTHTISWDARETLLAKLAQKKTVAWLEQEGLEFGVESTAAAIRARFEAVGASRPVELSADERNMLGWLLNSWPMTHEGVSDSTRRELLALLAALGRGEPADWSVEEWEEGKGLDLGGWRWKQWGPAEQSKYGDHDHCPFCNTRFSDRSEVDYDLDEGWVGRDETGYERWVCVGCFEKLRERFGWKTEQ